MISKGYLYHLILGKDRRFETPTLESLPLVYVFPEVCPSIFHRVPPEKEIDIIIDLLQDDQPIRFLLT